jgi:hypothetical protein
MTVPHFQSVAQAVATTDMLGSLPIHFTRQTARRCRRCYAGAHEGIRPFRIQGEERVPGGIPLAGRHDRIARRGGRGCRLAKVDAGDFRLLQQDRRSEAYGMDRHYGGTFDHERIFIARGTRGDRTVDVAARGSRIEAGAGSADGDPTSSANFGSNIPGLMDSAVIRP